MKLFFFFHLEKKIKLLNNIQDILTKMMLTIKILFYTIQIHKLT